MPRIVIIEITVRSAHHDRVRLDIAGSLSQLRNMNGDRLVVLNAAIYVLSDVVVSQLIDFVFKTKFGFKRTIPFRSGEFGKVRLVSQKAVYNKHFRMGDQARYRLKFAVRLL